MYDEEGRYIADKTTGIEESSASKANRARTESAGLKGSYSSSDISNALRSGTAGVPMAGGSQLPFSSSESGSYNIGKDRFDLSLASGSGSAYADSFTGNPYEYWDRTGAERSSSIERSAASQMWDRAQSDEDYAKRVLDEAEKNKHKPARIDARYRDIGRQLFRNRYKTLRNKVAVIPWNKFSPIKPYVA